MFDSWIVRWLYKKKFHRVQFGVDFRHSGALHIVINYQNVLTIFFVWMSVVSHEIYGDVNKVFYRNSIRVIPIRFDDKQPETNE